MSSASVYIEKLSLRKNVHFGDNKIVVGCAGLLCEDQNDWYDFSPKQRRSMTKAWNSDENKRADYIVFGAFEGSRVYKSTKPGVWSGTTENDSVGTLYKINGKWQIVPDSIDLEIKSILG